MTHPQRRGRSVGNPDVSRPPASILEQVLDCRLSVLATAQCPSLEAMETFRITMEFELQITDELAFGTVVHDFTKAIADQEGGAAGMGAANSQEVADLVGHDHRMGASTWAVRALQMGAGASQGAQLSGNVRVTKNEPLL